MWGLKRVDMLRYTGAKRLEQFGCAVLRVINRLVVSLAGVTKISGNVDNVHSQVLFGCCRQNNGNHGCRCAVRRCRKQRKVAAGLDLIQPFAVTGKSFGTIV